MTEIDEALREPMRDDMAKVIVERPRYDSRNKKPRKGYRREQSRYALDERPKRERMKHRSGATRWFSEHLSPLIRFLHKQVGRPWDKVFAEICKHINRNSAVQDHVRDHVFDIVVDKVELIDGIPHHLEGWWQGTPLKANSRWHSLYVCPKTGLLRRVKPRRKSSKPKPRAHAVVKVSRTQQCHFINGAWHLVELEPLPATPWRYSCTKRDVLLDRLVMEITPERARKRYGSLVYAARMRRLAKHELKHWPIPDDQRREKPQIVRRKR